MGSDRVLPFLKWPGGKRWLGPFVSKLVAGRLFERYFEPFLGGGAIFFELAPSNPHLSDINADLINVYRQVRDRPHELLDHLKTLSVDKKVYLAMRASDPRDGFERAVRFLYLNRTAFAGMYRLDRNGRFNVPFGGGQRTVEPLWRSDLVINASRALQGASLDVLDFEVVLSRTGSGDLVYCDPTYTVAHSANGFIRYNERNFAWDDQVRLATACSRAAMRGALVLVSNAFHADVLRLYADAEPYEVQRYCGVCPKGSRRGFVKEYLFLFT